MKVKWIGFPHEIKKAVGLIFAPHYFRKLTEIRLHAGAIPKEIKRITHGGAFGCTFLDKATKRTSIIIFDELIREELNVAREETRGAYLFTLCTAVVHEMCHHILLLLKEVRLGPYAGNHIYHDKIEIAVWNSTHYLLKKHEVFKAFGVKQDLWNKLVPEEERNK